MSKDISISVLRPDELSAEERDAFEQMVLEAGEVNSGTLPDLIDRALALAFARMGGALVGVGAIKRPNAPYRRKVFTSARSELDPEKFEFELGWFYVKPAARNQKCARRMVEALMPRIEGKDRYATSRVDNRAMHTALEKQGGLKKTGTPYHSTQNEPDIQLFVSRND